MWIFKELNKHLLQLFTEADEPYLGLNRIVIILWKVAVRATVKHLNKNDMT